jgi:clan AA aspartic protease
MEGIVDSAGRALITLELWRNGFSDPVSCEAWIDTGFTGELVVPESQIIAWGLPRCGSMDAILADGMQVELPTYACELDWFGDRRSLEVIANQGQHALLGVGLLIGLDLHISYRTGEITLQ